MGKKLLLVMAATIPTMVPVWAHHSFAAQFDQNKVVILQGTVARMEWVNPHAFIHIVVKNADGTITN